MCTVNFDLLWICSISKHKHIDKFDVSIQYFSLNFLACCGHLDVRALLVSAVAWPLGFDCKILFRHKTLVSKLKFAITVTKVLILFGSISNQKKRLVNSLKRKFSLQNVRIIKAIR